MSSSIGQNHTFLLLSTTCDEIWSWMIEIWMRIHSVSKWLSLQHRKFRIRPKSYKGLTNNVGLTFSVGDTIWRSTISVEQDN